MSKVGSWIAALLLVLFATAAPAQETPARPLFVVHFETGPQWKPELAPADQARFREHSANLGRLRKEGIIAFGARYGDYGMIFLRADSLDAATRMMTEDPGVQAGIFVFRIAPLSVFYPWQ